MDAYIGEIRMFAGSFAPVGWAFCDGSLVSVSNNEVLFAVIGTTWGGDGVNNFALPNLNGKVPVGQGAGTGLTPRVVGQTGGQTGVALSAAQLPLHNHLVAVSPAALATTGTPGPTVALANTGPATPPSPTAVYMINYLPPAKRPTPPATRSLDSSAVQPTGFAGAGLHAHPNMMPGLGVIFIVCTVGIFPSQ